jgi:NADH-quinone oxidoreductase subunit L
MLRNAWLIPFIPVLSFFLILFFGKRLPQRGAEIGVLALAICFGLSLVTAGQWISREKTVEIVHHGAEHGGESHGKAEGGHSKKADDGHSDKADDGHGDEADDEHAAGELARSAPAKGGEKGEKEADKARAPVVREVSWFENQGVTIKAGTLVDGLTVALLLVVSTISLLVHIFSTTAARPTTSPRSASSPRACSSWSPPARRCR